MIERKTWRERFMAGEAEVADLWDDVKAHHAGKAWPLPMQHWLGLSLEEFGVLLLNPQDFERLMAEKREAGR